MIELVIFDCDGVLVDSEIIAARVTADLLRSIGVGLSYEDVLTDFVGLDAQATHQRIEAKFGVVLPPDFHARAERALESAFRTDLRLSSGVDSVLEHLAVPFCVASNSGHVRLRTTFAVTGLAHLVEGRVFSADDVPRGKPAPDLFLHAARAMGNIPSERCLVVEDSASGVIAARAAGMRVVGYCGGSHIRPGHGQRLRALGAEAVVTHHADLHVWVPVRPGASQADLLHR